MGGMGGAFGGGPMGGLNPNMPHKPVMGDAEMRKLARERAGGR